MRCLEFPDERITDGSTVIPDSPLQRVTEPGYESIDHALGKTEPALGKTEPALGKTEPAFGATVTFHGISVPSDVAQSDVTQSDAGRDCRTGNRALIRCLSWMTPGLVAFTIAMVLAYYAPPAPDMHDDFGNILVADTLLHGRLTNPTPPAAEALQSFHVVVYPTYASKYPIGIGASLAAGKLLFGSYAAGMWLCAAIASSAISWMLLSHFGPKWSWTMGMVCAMHPGWQNSWSQEFTHGYLAVAGAALVLGGILRMRKRMFRSDVHSQRPWIIALMIAIGCSLLLFSRPFEGSILCCLVSIPMLWLIASQHWYRQSRFWIAATPGILVLLSSISLQLAINHQVTGRYSQLPYQLHETQYGVAPVFVWQKPHEPTLGHRFPEQQLFHYGWSMICYNKLGSFTNYLQMFLSRLETMRSHWGQLIAVCPLLVLAFSRERALFGWLLCIAFAALLLFNCVPWVMPHYIAPLIPIAIFLTCCTLYRIQKLLSEIISTNASFRRLRPKYILPAFVIFLFANQIVPFAYARRDQYVTPQTQWFYRRAELIKKLDKEAGNDLVFVRYEPGHDIMREWVFNGASPQTDSVVFARWADEALNAEVLASYPQRKVWMLDVDRFDIETLTPR